MDDEYRYKRDGETSKEVNKRIIKGDLFSFIIVFGYFAFFLFIALSIEYP